MRMLLMLLTSLLVLAAPATAAVRAVDGGIEFSYTDPSAGSVHVAGAFNGWDTSATALTRGEEGTWRVVVPLDAGRHEYKFVVNGGTWVADPDNPVVGGDYGNSIVEVNASGAIVSSTGVRSTPAQPSGTAALSNTPLHSRVVLGGFFRLLMESTDNQPGDSRLRVDRPQDQFNLDVTANLNESIWGSARLQVRTDAGDFNRIGSSLYKAQANFDADDFRVSAFYNEEAYSSDDPLGLFAGGDLRGTIQRERRPFGQGRQGAILRLSPWGTEFAFMYADTYDEDIFGPEDANRDTGTDVLGARWTAPIGRGRVGLSYRGVMSAWWVNMDATGNTTPDEIQDFLDNRTELPNEDEDWFELSNQDHQGEVDVAWPFAGDFTATAALGYGWYEAKWDVFNKGSIKGSGQTNGPVDFTVGNEQRYRGIAALRYEKAAYSLSAAQEWLHGLGMDAGEQAAAYRTQPASLVGDADSYALNGIDQVYTRPNGNDDLAIFLLGPTPERTILRTHLAGSYRWREFDLGLEFTRTKDDLTYAEFFGTGMEADLERFAFRTAPRVTYRPFEDERHHLTLLGEILQYSDPGALRDQGFAALANPDVPQTGYGHLFRIPSTELILEGRVPTPEFVRYPLDLRFDLRYMDYRGDDVTISIFDPNGTQIGEVTDADNFFDPFLAVVYSPAPSVEIEVGYGVDPRFYDVITAEGWGNGRHRFRENFLRGGGVDPFHPLTHLVAEQELEDRNQIVINALLKF